MCAAVRPPPNAGGTTHTASDTQPVDVDWRQLAITIAAGTAPSCLRVASWQGQLPPPADFLSEVLKPTAPTFLFFPLPHRADGTITPGGLTVMRELCTSKQGPIVGLGLTVPPHRDRDSVVEECVSSPTCPDLLTLTLSVTPARVALLAKLLSSGQHPETFDLHITKANLRNPRQAIHALATAVASGHCKPFLVLDISSAFDPSAVSAFAVALPSGECPPYFQLHLASDPPGVDRLAAALCAGGCPDHLALHIHSSVVPGGGWARLGLSSFVALCGSLSSGKCPANLTLGFPGWDLSMPECYTPLADALRGGNSPSHLSLSFKGHRIPTAGLRALCAAIASGNAPTHLDLNLHATQLRSESLTFLGHALDSGKSPGHLTLRLGGDSLQCLPSICAAMRQGKAPQHLTLDLLGNCFSELEGAASDMLCEALRSGRCPRNLTLRARVGVAKLPGFADALRSGRCPISLNLQLRTSTPISQKEISPISDALGSGTCPSGLTLDLSWNRLSECAVASLSEALSSGGCASLSLTLVLDGNRLGVAHLRHISSALASGRCPPNLTLSLQACTIGRAGCEVLGRALSLPGCPQCLTLALPANPLRGSPLRDTLLELLRQGAVPEGLTLCAPLCAAQDAPPGWRAEVRVERTSLFRQEWGAVAVITRESSRASTPTPTHARGGGAAAEQAGGVSSLGRAAAAATDVVSKRRAAKALLGTLSAISDAEWRRVGSVPLLGVDSACADLERAMDAVRADPTPDAISRRDAARAAYIAAVSNACKFPASEVLQWGAPLLGAVLRLAGGTLPPPAGGCDVDMEVTEAEGLALAARDAAPALQRLGDSLEADAGAGKAAADFAAQLRAAADCVEDGCAEGAAAVWEKLEGMGQIMTTVRCGADDNLAELWGFARRLDKWHAALEALVGQMPSLHAVLERERGRVAKAAVVERLDHDERMLKDATHAVDDAEYELRKAQRKGASGAEEEAVLRQARFALRAARCCTDRGLADASRVALVYYPELAVQNLSVRWGGLEVKRQLADYSDVQSLAQGRHGVYLATRDDGVRCVLKLFAIEGNGTECFFREAQMLQRLQHPCVAEVTCVFVDKLGCYMEMPYYARGTLADHMALPDRNAAQTHQLLLDTARGLEHVHRSGIVHCDVKPENVFVAEDGTAKLGDFDISKDMASRAVSTMDTRQTAMRGTRGFMAPEVENGRTAASFASDIYSLGLILYDALSHAPRGLAAPPSLAATPGLPPDALDLVRCMLNPKPSARPTAEQVTRHAFFRCASDQRGRAPALSSPASWRNPQALGEMVDVTASLGPALQDMVSRTSGGVKLTVEHAFRIEHHLLWEAYQLQRHQMISRLQASPPDAFFSSACESQVLSKQALYGGVNELHLFHGTSPQVAPVVVQQGMDERVAVRGLYGAGIYFAEDSAKSAQYVTSDGRGLCPMFVCRVLVGSAYVTKAHLTNTLRKPPCHKGHQKCMNHEAADSVVADVRTREFVVYDKARVYPEFLMWLRRRK